MLDMLLKSVGINPADIPNYIAEFRSLLSAFVAGQKLTNDRLARIEKALNIEPVATETKEIEHE